MKDYRFHPRLFNPLFWHVRAALNNTDLRFIFIYGGSSAAKTYSIVQALLLDQAQKGYNLAVFRKESTTIDDTVYADYKEITERLMLSSEVQFIEKEMRIPSSEVYTKFKGLDDPEKIKGLSAYQHVYLNELSKFDFSDFKEAKRRLRGKPGQKIIADWNPISEEHWIKTEVVDKEEWTDLPLTAVAPTKYNSLDPGYSSVKINASGNTLMICTTYRDNYWIVGHPSGQGGFVDKATLDEFEWLRANDENDYNVYALGRYGTVQTGKEFFDNFSRVRHVKENIEMLSDQSVIFSFDFNNLPYSTCLAIQTKRDGSRLKIRVIDEICLRPPANTIEDIYDDIQYRMPWVKSAFYCIDPSGRANTQRKGREEAWSYDDMIRRTFASLIHGRSDMTPTSAPPLAFRRMAMKRILSGSENIDLEISDRCKNLISDFERLLIDTSGGYQKKRETDKATGLSYEKNGHCMDALIYLLASMFANLFYRDRT